MFALVVLFRVGSDPVADRSPVQAILMVLTKKLNVIPNLSLLVTEEIKPIHLVSKYEENTEF
jgi:hypothetical protein